MTHLNEDVASVNLKQLAALTELASLDSPPVTSQITMLASRAVFESLKYKGLITNIGTPKVGRPATPCTWEITEKGYRALRQVDKLYERAVELGI